MPAAASDEGIVQPAAKAAEKLSPRLHQTMVPGRSAGNHTFGRVSKPNLNKDTAFTDSSRPASWIVCALSVQPWLRLMQRVKRLSSSEAAYVAGIIDGEGTITLTRTHRGEYRRPIVSISSTELPLLSYVQRVVGAGRITNKRCDRAHHSASFAYTPSSRQALRLLIQIARHLRTYKAGRARLLIEEYLLVSRRNGRYPPAELSARAAFERRFFSIAVRAANSGPYRPGSR